MTTKIISYSTGFVKAEKPLDLRKHTDFFTISKSVPCPTPLPALLTIALILRWFLCFGTAVRSHIKYVIERPTSFLSEKKKKGAEKWGAYGIAYNNILLPKNKAANLSQRDAALFTICTLKNMCIQISIAFSSSKNCSIPIYRIPLSSCHGMILSFTTTIFLNESPTRFREFISCCRLSSSLTVSADWI